MDFTRDSLLKKVTEIYSEKGFKESTCSSAAVKNQNTVCFLTNFYPKDIEEILKEFSDYNLVKLGDWQFESEAGYLRLKYQGNSKLYVSLFVVPTNDPTTLKHANSGFGRLLEIDVDDAY